MEKIALKDKQHLVAFLEAVRTQLESHFAPDTAAPGLGSNRPSAGQCAAVATIVNEILGGEFRSAIVEGQSHWFNQIRLGKEMVEIDLTGDQFGRAAVQITATPSLYPGAKIRNFEELKPETISRAVILADRSGLYKTATSLRIALSGKHLNREIEP